MRKDAVITKNLSQLDPENLCTGSYLFFPLVPPYVNHSCLILLILATSR